MDDLRGLKPPLGFGMPWGALAVLVLLVLAAAASWWWWHRREAEGPADERVARVPDLRRRLDALAAKGWAEAGEAARFHDALQGILREHLRNVYAVRGERLTTSELVEELAARAVEEAVVERVRTLLEACDLVKFAKARPDAARMGQVLLAAYDLCPVPAAAARPRPAEGRP